MKFKMEKLEVKNIKQHPENPRTLTKQQRQRLKKSLEKIDYIEPILVNKHNGYILSGNQRFDVLKNDLGYRTLDCAVVDFDDPILEKKILVHLNSTSGEFDNEKLIPILESISPDKLLNTGLSENKLKNFGFSIEKKDVEIPKLASEKLSKVELNDEKNPTESPADKLVKATKDIQNNNDNIPNEVSNNSNSENLDKNSETILGNSDKNENKTSNLKVDKTSKSNKHNFCSFGGIKIQVSDEERAALTVLIDEWVGYSGIISGFWGALLFEE